MMKYELSNEHKPRLLRLMKAGGKGIIILIAAVMSFKFMSWNSFKLEHVVAIARELVQKPPAINVAILLQGGLGRRPSSLFQKSFAFNEKGNCYIINQFDISDYIQDEADLKADNIKITINGREMTSFMLFQFKHYNVLFTGGYYFIFTKANSNIEEMIQLDQSVLRIENVLFKLAAMGKNGEDEGKKEIIYQYFQGAEKELTYGSARVSIPLPGFYKKGKLYEIVFDYKVSGGVKPEVMLAPISKKYELGITEEGIYRKAGLLFSPQGDIEAPELNFLGRAKGKKGHFDGTVSLKDIFVYSYEKEYPWLKKFVSQVVYFDIIDKMKEELIGVKFFEK